MNKNIIFSITSVLLFLINLSISYADNKDVELSSGSEISIRVFEADNDKIFLYLPSERGFGNGYINSAEELSFMGFDTWVLDLHSSYMVNKTRNSIDKFSVSDLILLLEELKTKKYQELYFITSGRGAKLALDAAYQWQIKYPNSKFVKGHIFHTPHLITSSNLESKANYVEIAKHSNLPIYMLFPQFSTKYFRANEIAGVLKTGGSQVFVHKLAGIRGGFHMRPDEDLTDKDINLKNKLAAMYISAIKLMANINVAKITKFKNVNTNKGSKNNKAGKLKEFSKKIDAPIIKTKDLKGNAFNSKSIKGSVVLVNFWASWCKPCVKEMPSLMRLKNKLASENFKIIAVNIGESKEDILKFKDKIKFDFPALLDLDGKIVIDWNVYAYPTSFIVNKNNKIHYGYIGSLEWDDIEIVDIIKGLL